MFGKDKSKTVLISNRSKFIFIHNYKVAGTSVRKSFAPYVDTKEWLMSNFLYYLKVKRFGDFIGVRKHANALEVKDVLGSKYEDYFSFGLVRNPWDWEVSNYHYQLKNTKHFRHEFIKSLGTFDNYVKWKETKNRTQLSFFTDDKDKIIVDLIGKIEELDKFYSDIEQRLKVKLRRYNLNKSRSDNEYRQFYSEETKRIIGRIYKTDIEMFQYSF